MSQVSVNTYTHSVTYVADNILKSFKDIINSVGLDPSAFVEDWAVNRLGIATWLESGHLKRVYLEIFDPTTDELVTRWDIDIVYAHCGDGGFYTDTDQLRYHIQKAGLAPSRARYRFVASTHSGRPAVAGWSSCNSRSTSGMTRQSLGSTVQHNGLGGNTSYWRKN